MSLVWICAARHCGGAENATLHVLRMLRARGIAVEAMCPEGPVAAAARGEGFAVDVARLGGALNLRAARAVTARLWGRRRNAADVALVTTADEWVWSCLGKPWRPAPRLVLIRFMALALPARVQRLARWRADAVVAVSEAVRRSLARISGDRVHVIRLAARFPPRAEVPAPRERLSAREAVGLPPTGRCVAFFGGLDPSKGIADVVSAVAAANLRLGEVHLAVCGPQAATGDREALRRLVGRRELQGRIHHLGTVERVEPVMTAADAVVVATRSALGEAIPLTAIEAMACGTPVCGYDVGGVSEALGDDGRAGRLARPDDPEGLARVLIDVLSDAGDAAAMAGRALARVRREFDPGEAARRYHELFASLTGRSA